MIDFIKETFLESLMFKKKSILSKQGECSISSYYDKMAFDRWWQIWQVHQTVKVI